MVADFARTLKSYRVGKVFGDRYAGEWPREQFGKFGIGYEASAKPKSELYIDLLPLINSARIDLLDNSKLSNQLVGLERRTARGGRDSIDHHPGGHDDLANAVAGLASVASKYGSYDHSYRAFSPDYQDPDSSSVAVTPPAGQPEPPQCNGNWWKSMPRSQPTYSADERLRGLYQSLDFAFKSGFFR